MVGDTVEQGWDQGAWPGDLGKEPIYGWSWIGTEITPEKGIRCSVGHLELRAKGWQSSG